MTSSTAPPPTLSAPPPTDAAERDREQALAAATAQGAEVSRDDFAFPDWQPGQDYAYS